MVRKKIEYVIKSSISKYKNYGLVKLIEIGYRIVKNKIKTLKYIDKFLNSETYARLYWLVRGRKIIDNGDGWILSSIISESEWYFPELEDNERMKKWFWNSRKSEYYGSSFLSIKKGDIIMDIGAYIGTTSVMVAEKAEKVYAVEPSPSVLGYLKKNTKKYENIYVIEYAISNERGEVDMEMGKAPSDDSLIKPDDGGRGEHYTVEVQTVEGIIEEEGIQKIDLLKVECEGLEPEVVKGIDHKRVKQVVSTGNDERYGKNTFNDVEQVLSEMGYTTMVDLSSPQKMVYAKK